MNLSEIKENIEEIKQGKLWYERCLVKLGDEKPVYDENHYNKTFGGWFITGGDGESGRILHRLDGPALVGVSGEVIGAGAWVVFGCYHRLDGPSTINVDGNVSWSLYGVVARSFEAYEEMDACDRNEIVIWKLKYGSPEQWDGGLDIVHPPKKYSI